MAKVKCPNPISKEKYGVMFINGVAEIEDEYLVSRLVERGYKVIDEPKEVAEAPKAEAVENDAIEEAIANEEAKINAEIEADKKKASKAKK